MGIVQQRTLRPRAVIPVTEGSRTRTQAKPMAHRPLHHLLSTNSVKRLQTALGFKYSCHVRTKTQGGRQPPEGLPVCSRGKCQPCKGSPGRALKLRPRPAPTLPGPEPSGQHGSCNCCVNTESTRNECGLTALPRVPLRTSDDTAHGERQHGWPVGP